MTEQKERWVLLRKVVLGVFWYLVMWLGMHNATSLLVGFSAGRHIQDPVQAGQAGATAAQHFSDRYGPVMIALALGLTLKGLRSGFFLSKKLRQARSSKA